MLKIGEFARIAQISVRMLRHYDKLGLLKPSSIDAVTGYRYYSIDQLPRLYRLLALKDLGLSLEQVMRLLDEQVTHTELRGMLRLKQAELRQQIAASALRLEQVEHRLTEMEEEGNHLHYDIVLKDIPATPALTCQRTMPPLTGEGFSDLFWDGSRAIRRAGFEYQSVFALSYNPYFVFQREFTTEWPYRFEAVFTVQSPEARRVPLSSGGCLERREIPGCELAVSTIHAGSDRTRRFAHLAICQWMEKHGYTLAGPARDIYLRRGCKADSDEHLTEIQYPIRKLTIKSKS